MKTNLTKHFYDKANSIKFEKCHTSETFRKICYEQNKCKECQTKNEKK